MNDRADHTAVILVVDSKASSRARACSALEGKGFYVLEAKDGPSALDLLSGCSPDLVLVQAGMPHMDGIEFCERLRRLPGKDRIPVLVITGNKDLDSVGRAFDAGATDFVTKPVSWPAVCCRIHYLLRSSSSFKDLYESEARNQALLSAIPDDMFWVRACGSLVKTKDRKSDLLSRNTDDSERQNLFHILPARLAEELLVQVHQVLDTGEVRQIEYPSREAGLLQEWEFRLVKSGSDQVLVILRDVTERNRTERALRESEERYSIAAEAANDGLWDWNITANEIDFSSRWATMLGYEPNALSKNIEEWFGRVHPHDLAQLKTQINKHLHGATDHMESEYRIMHRDGTFRWMLTRGKGLRDQDGKVYRMAGSQADIHSKKQAEEQLVHDAFYDALTGLPNRSLLTDRLGHAIRKAKRSLSSFLYCVIFLDLDRFKVVNDSLGHLAGDRLLVETARRIERCVRPGDTIARLGGDEFVVLLEDINHLYNAETIAKRIQQAIGLPFQINGREIFTSASMGIAIGNAEYNTPEEILQDADITMYRAKALGKARIEIFDENLRAEAVSLLTRETELRRAIETEAFTIYYQPIVSLDTGVIESIEALVRWQHPVKGLVQPGDFIPLAEETGLIIQIGDFVLRKVCGQIRAWQDEGLPKVRVAVNVSPVQFRQERFAESIRQTLEEAGVDASCLDIEITESLFLDQSKSTIATLKKLKELGIRICLDDFGTGYSSLSYLRNLPIEVLKIHQSFITKMDEDSDQARIMSTIVSLGKNLGMEVIAEGIETDEQLARLKLIRCSNGQGYLFSEPVDSCTARNLLACGLSRDFGDSGIAVART